MDNALSNASTILNCHNRKNQLGQDLTSIGRDIKNKINAWFEQDDIDDEGGEGSGVSSGSSISSVGSEVPPSIEEKVGGGCGMSKKTVKPTLTQEEIDQWLDYFNNETNDNEKNIKMGWYQGTGGGNPDLTQEETDLLIALFP